MNKNTKTITIVVVVLVVLALVLALAWQKKQSSNNDPEVKEEIKGWDTFTDPTEAISFMHNPGLQVNPGNSETPTPGWSKHLGLPGLLLAEANMPGVAQSGRFTIGRSADPEAITACTTGAAKEKSMGTSEIGGYSFIRFISSEMSGKDASETTSYRGIVDGDCYAVEYTINTSGAEPAAGTEENINVMQRELENMVQSARFLVNSD